VQTEKFKLSFLILFCAVIWLCAGCVTRPPVVFATDESLISSIDSNRQIRAINERVSGILQFHDEFIRDAVERTRTGNLDARRALAEYDEFVQELIRRIMELEELTHGMDTEILEPLSYLYDRHGIIRIECYWQNYNSRIEKQGS
jgi:hypothetical protein